MAKKRSKAVSTAPTEGDNDTRGDSQAGDTSQAPDPPAPTEPVAAGNGEVGAAGDVAKERCSNCGTVRGAGDKGNASATMPDRDANGDGGGDIAFTAAVEVPSDVPSPSRVRELVRAVSRRLDQQVGADIWHPLRDEMMRSCRKGPLKMDLAAARWWTYRELERIYPPPEQTTKKGTMSPSGCQAETPEIVGSGDISGLTSLPGDWPTLPGNASQHTEFAWVQAQRLLIVREKGRGHVVDLSRATEPPPSMATLSWLELSIRSPAKWSDMAARGLTEDADDAEYTRRERMAISEIESILSEMHEDAT